MEDTRIHTGLVGRFAPSPTGNLHAGHVFSYLVDWLIVRRSGGKMVLRIEDLDAQRSRHAYAEQIMRDLDMLGLGWDEGPYYQHDRTDAYEQAYARIKERASVYPCFCSRADILASSAPHEGEAAIYAGTCRNLSEEERVSREGQLEQLGRSASMRLLMPDRECTFEDLFQGKHCFNLERQCGDVILRRADNSFAYHLAVVVDDAEQGVNTVVRGCDLVSSTPIQIHLQDLLGKEHPHYAHVPLIVNANGARLAKRDKAAGLSELLERWKSVEVLLGRIAQLSGLIPEYEPCTAEELLSSAELDALANKRSIVWDG